MNYCIEKQTMACMAYVTNCYMHLEKSLNKCKSNDQLILKNRIFDMLDRVKFLLDKKYVNIIENNPDNAKYKKGDNIMRHEHENARRHAYNTLAEVNRHLDKGNIKNPRHHQMLTDMAEKATRTLNNLDDMENKRPYSDTNIGYNADTRQRGRARNDADDAIRNVMDAIDRILPHIADDDRYDVDNRRGVPGSGRGRRIRADRYDDRYDMDDDLYDDEVVDMPRWRSARTGRFLPNLYGPSRVRRVRRRADMDDMRYDDDRYDYTHDRNDIYPGTPVMPRNDDRSNARYETRSDTRDDIRDDSTNDKSDRPGPGMRR